MRSSHLSEQVKKNLLDMHYLKYTQYYTTCVILLTTYFIGIVIGFVTKQLDFRNTLQLSIVSAVSLVIVGVFVRLMLNFHVHIKRIPEEIKKLRI
jgi:hypothetical protein